MTYHEMQQTQKIRIFCQNTSNNNPRTFQELFVELRCSEVSNQVPIFLIYVSQHKFNETFIMQILFSKNKKCHGTILCKTSQGQSIISSQVIINVAQKLKPIVSWLWYQYKAQIIIFLMQGEQEEFKVRQEAGQLPQQLIQESAVDKKREKEKRCGRWKRRENGRYLSFLRKYYYIMRDSGLRYHYRIFNKMAELIGTRNSTQCKSHHQKMLKKYNQSLQNIVFKTELDNQLVTIGEGETHLSHTNIVKQGMKMLQMGDHPFLTVKVDEKLLIVINEQLVDQY